jgi:hypothetical protein
MIPWFYDTALFFHGGRCCDPRRTSCLHGEEPYLDGVAPFFHGAASLRDGVAPFFHGERPF